MRIVSVLLLGAATCGALTVDIPPLGTERPATGALLSRRFLGLDEDTWDPVYTETKYGTLTVTGEVRFDAFGRETARTDALGNAVTNSYDALGRLVSVSGAIYPVKHGYDSAGRRVSLATTRGGATWDTTRWGYDPAGGVVTNKTYADGSRISYTHTPDGKPLSTTRARGACRENGYNADGLLATTAYSDATPAVELDYDAFHRLASASNSVAQYAYLNSALGTATNQSLW